jgi:hypothetical protein
MAKLRHLRRARGEESRWRVLNVPQSRCDRCIAGSKPSREGVVDEVIRHEALGGTTTGEPSSDSRSLKAEIPSIIEPFCFEAIRRRKARSRTARFDFSPVSALARSSNFRSKSALVTAMMGHLPSLINCIKIDPERHCCFTETLIQAAEPHLRAVPTFLSVQAIQTLGLNPAGRKPSAAWHSQPDSGSPPAVGIRFAAMASMGPAWVSKTSPAGPRTTRCAKNTIRAAQIMVDGSGRRPVASVW